MNQHQQQRLDEMIKIIRESAEKIIDANQYTAPELIAMLYREGFNFLQDPRDQTMVNIGAIGLAFSILRATAAGEFNKN